MYRQDSGNSEENCNIALYWGTASLFDESSWKLTGSMMEERLGDFFWKVFSVERFFQA
jgi:hypothetical protein